MTKLGRRRDRVDRYGRLLLLNHGARRTLSQYEGCVTPGLANRAATAKGAICVREWDVPGYTELKALGSGGSSDVVLARHDASGSLVAGGLTSVTGAAMLALAACGEQDRFGGVRHNLTAWLYQHGNLSPCQVEDPSLVAIPEPALNEYLAEARLGPRRGDQHGGLGSSRVHEAEGAWLGRIRRRGTGQA